MSWKSLRLGVLISAILVIGAVLIVLMPMGYVLGHKLELKTYFQYVAGLRDGAPVRLAGVDVGKVRSVRVRPEVRKAPWKWSWFLAHRTRFKSRAIQS